MSTDRDEQEAPGEEVSVAPPISPATGEGAIAQDPALESASVAFEGDLAAPAAADPHGLPDADGDLVGSLATPEEGLAEAQEADPEADVSVEEPRAFESSALLGDPEDELPGQAASGFEARAEEGGEIPLSSFAEDAFLVSAEEGESSSELMAAGGNPVSAPGADSSEPSAESLLPILEAVLFASPTPLTVGQIQNIFSDGLSAPRAREALQFLAERCDRDRRGIVLCEIAGGWQFLTREEYFPFVQRVARVKHDDRLTAAGIETLAVVAYRQPISRAEVDAIRGVSSAPLIRTLMDRGLVRVTGRASTPGNPFQYGTTPKFLRHFGLKSEKDLPDPRDLQRLLAEREASHGP